MLGYVTFLIFLQSIYNFQAIREINKNYHLFNDQINVTDVLQGEGQTCYIFAALASLVNLPRGDQYIRNAFVVINEVF